jgi:hypothetical protein
MGLCLHPKERKPFFIQIMRQTPQYELFNSRYLVLWIFVVYLGVLSCGLFLVASSSINFLSNIPFNVLQKMKFNKFTMHISLLDISLFKRHFACLAMGVHPNNFQIVKEHIWNKFLFL